MCQGVVGCGGSDLVSALSDLHMKECALLLLISFLLQGCGSSVDDNPQALSANTVKIGLLAPLTGPVASFGRILEQSSKLAVKDINDAGGVNGQLVQLVVRDDQFDVATAQEEAQHLVDLGVVALLGPAASFITIPVAENVTIPAGLALLSPSATSASITDLADNNTVFRTVVSDAFQGLLLAEVIEEQGVTSIAIIQVDDVYGNGLTDTLVGAFSGEVLARVKYPGGKENNFGSEVNELFSNGVPEAVVMVTFNVDGANITRDILAHNPQPLPRFFAGDGVVSAAFIENAAPSIIEGLIGTESSPPQDLPNFALYRQHLAETLGISDPGDAVEGYSMYDAAFLVMLAMAQGGENTREAVLANIRAVSEAESDDAQVVNVNEFSIGLAAIAQGLDINYEGANGSVDFDSNGDIQNGFYSVQQIQRDSNGILQFVQIDSRAVPF